MFFFKFLINIWKIVQLILNICRFPIYIWEKVKQFKKIHKHFCKNFRIILEKVGNIFGIVLDENLKKKIE